MGTLLNKHIIVLRHTHKVPVGINVLPQPHKVPVGYVLPRAQIVPVGSVRFCGWWYAPPPPCMAVRSFGGLRNDFSIDSNVLRHAHKVPEMTEAPSRKVVSDGASGFVWATSV